MIRDFLRISVAVLLIHNISCSKGSDSDVSRKMVCEAGELKSVGIFGGKALSKDSVAGRGMVMILTTEGSKSYMCTGSLIDRNIILTAAHCVPANQDPIEVSIAFSGDPVCQLRNEGSSAFKSVDRIIRHPKFIGRGHFSDNDLAMIRLKAPVPQDMQPLKLMNRRVSLDSSSQVYISGYGQATDYNTPDPERPILKVASVEPLQDSDDPDKITRDNSSKVLYLDQRKGQGACAGDSGGPTFLKDQGQLFVLGVNSAVDSLEKSDFRLQDEVTCRKGLRIVSVFSQLEWISTTYRQLLNEDSLGNQFDP